MGVYVGKWDCDYCGNMGNLGPHSHCLQCGGSRPEDVVFYMPRGVDTEVTDEDELSIAKEGANWVCGLCNNSNRNSYKACVSCGALKDASEKNLEVRAFSEEAVPRTSQPVQKLATPEQPKKKGKFGKIIAFIAILGSGYFGLSQISSTIEVPVTSIEWERSIETEEFKLVTEEGWELPKSGKIIKSFEAIHHYDSIVVDYQTRTRTVKEAVGSEQYVCGKRDLGNGYFEDKYCNRTIYRDRQEQYEDPIYQESPIYKTKYQYGIYRWKPYENYETEGSDKQPKWGELPDFIKDKENQKIRVKSENEAYYFAIKDHKDEIRWYKSDFDYWNDEISVRKTLKAKKSMIFGFFQYLEDEHKVVSVERD
jgi:hypothetical protein